MNRIVRFIEKEYDLTQVRIDSVLQEKGGRAVYKINTDKGVCVYKSANEAKTKKDMERDMHIFDFATKNSFKHIPTILKTRSGHTFAKNGRKYVHIMEFIDSGEPAGNAESWRKIGRITAELHALESYPYKTPFTSESEKDTYKEVAKHIPFGKEYLDIANSLPEFKNCVQSLIHTDIGLHNIAKDKADQFYFLDWDDVGIGISILDLGFPLLSQFLDEQGVFHKDNASAFYSSYFQHREIPVADKQMIFDIGLFFQLIYLPYGDVEQNWKKIKIAIKNRADIVSVIPI